MSQNPQIEAKPCPHCGAKLHHIESLAKSFDPPRVYHEWHHTENRDCWLRERLGLIMMTAADINAVEEVAAWNRRALCASQEAAAPSEAMRDELLAADASDPEATFDNGADMLDWLNAPAAAPSEEPVAWRGVVDGRTASLCRTRDEIDRLASDYNATIEPLGVLASPAVAPVAQSEPADLIERLRGPVFGTQTALDAATAIETWKARAERLADMHRDMCVVAGEAVARAETAEAALSTAPSGDGVPVCRVMTMEHSSGEPDHYVSVEVGDRQITPHCFKIRGRAEYEVAEWKWLFNGGEKPFVLDFDTSSGETKP